jgi:hypothetical protein
MHATTVEENEIVGDVQEISRGLWNIKINLRDYGNQTLKPILGQLNLLHAVMLIITCHVEVSVIKINKI